MFFYAYLLIFNSQFLKDLKFMNKMAAFCTQCESARTSKRVPIQILQDTIQYVDLKLSTIQSYLSNKPVFEIFQQCRRDFADLHHKYVLTAQIQIEPNCTHHCYECNALSKFCNFHDFKNSKQMQRRSVDNISKSKNEVQLQTNVLNTENL